MRRATSLVRAAVVCLALVVCASSAEAYLQFIVPLRGIPTVLKWKRMPVRWFATDASASGVPAAALQATAAHAFSSWESVPTASISFAYVGFTGASPFADDGLSVIGFANEPDEDRTLAATGFTIDTLTGEIVESDIFVNSAFLWSTASAGDPARYDLESVLVHEIGHFLGLDHSLVGETELLGPDARRVLASGSVMFPIAFGRGNTADRALQPDDIAGVSSLYPDGSFTSATGTVRGHVQKNGRGVFGAHIVAFNVQTGTLIGGFTLNTSGEYEIMGLSPGPYVIRVEPLDDASIESFFIASDPVDANFSVTYADRLIIVGAGGVTSSVDITVRAK
ncbi:MAG: matrixin family metalloprotease [Vicinamibacterales bacterium]